MTRTTTPEQPISKVVAFPTSQPDGEVVGHVEPGTSLDETPTWAVQTLNAGPARSSPAYDRHLQGTMGSSYDWSDELRFDKRTGRLTSFVLKTPEAGVLDPEIPRCARRCRHCAPASEMSTRAGPCTGERRRAHPRDILSRVGHLGVRTRRGLSQAPSQAALPGQSPYAA